MCCADTRSLSPVGIKRKISPAALKPEIVEAIEKDRDADLEVLREKRRRDDEAEAARREKERAEAEAKRPRPADVPAEVSPREGGGESGGWVVITSRRSSSSHVCVPLRTCSSKSYLTSPHISFHRARLSSSSTPTVQSQQHVNRTSAN